MRTNTDNFLYEKLYESIRKKIIEGQIKKGDKLPSVRSLSRDFNLSINTVLQAYYQLELEGYIESKERVGFFCKEIDDLIILDDINEEISFGIEDYKLPYDFTFSGVDAEYFPFATWRKMLKESVKEHDESLVERGHYKGYPALRQAIVSYIRRARGVEVKSDNIVISSGIESLFDLLKKLLNKESLYAFENPGYAFGNRSFTYDLANPIPLSLDEEGVKIENIRDLNSCAVFVTPYHQFPMGTVMSIQRRIELLNWASQSKDRFIIEDDYEAEFIFKGRAVSALKSMDKNDDVIYLGSFSKVISPALRISYMALPDILMKKFENNFNSFGCPVSLYIQKATEQFISEGYFQKHINRMKNVYLNKYQYSVSILESIENLEIISESSSLVILIRILKDIEPKNLIAILKERGVGIRSVNDFSYRKSGFDNLYIIGFASLRKEDIYKGLSILAKSIK